LEQDKNTVKEVEVPYFPCQSEVFENSGKKSHKPLEDVLSRLYSLKLKVLAQFWQFISKYLLVQLHYFPDKNIIKVVEGKDGVLGHQIAKGDKSHQLVLSVDQQHRSDIRHPLHITDIWPVHRKCLQNLFESQPLIRRYLFKMSERSWYICVDYENGSFF